MTTPKQEQVGFLLPLTCGHNRHPNTIESSQITMHLEIAGFLKPLELEKVEEIVSCQSSPKKPISEAVKAQSKAQQEASSPDKGPPSQRDSPQKQD